MTQQNELRRFYNEQLQPGFWSRFYDWKNGRQMPPERKVLAYERPRVTSARNRTTEQLKAFVHEKKCYG